MAPLHHHQVLGYTPTLNGGLGMTANSTHTRPETRTEQFERALLRWAKSLTYALERLDLG